MNLREETIKVLRPLAEIANDYFEWQSDATQLLTTENIVLTLSDARRARAFLSRLEAGSGEEAKSGAGQRILAGIQDAIDGNFAAVFIDGQHWIREPTKADEPTAYESVPSITSNGTRPHVATPAPGENSGRADNQPKWLAMDTAGKLISAVLNTNPGTTNRADAIADLLTFVAAEYSRGFASGRRSGLEEAAKVAEHEKATLGGDDGWAKGYATACDDVAAAIRAIPEKQS